MSQNYDNAYMLQSGYTLIELMVVVAIVGILATIATTGYYMQIRQTQLSTIYQELSNFRMPYQMLINEGATAASFSATGLNLSAQSKYCQFSVMPPSDNGSAPSAITCHIQNLNYLQDEFMTLSVTADGIWQCMTSPDIAEIYLPYACK
ncbi:prepilin-type N-terminal cleavage/methylation domain-containing protein [Psychrobacter sp. ANT_WB68]|uniref:pilin n=1 Tax=Psychrobacter sp. ANT_WB68 TaxID=2597355 RepID=UPI0011F33506|nr:prepilin-type N-terminal cleavage/methylation domain-containing protein [Psychrobacter sp. ANT_WB68]KAA0913844.1 pilin [Psychrobacter sp. ANT_WB68]